MLDSNIKNMSQCSLFLMKCLEASVNHNFVVTILFNLSLTIIHAVQFACSV